MSDRVFPLILEYQVNFIQAQSDIAQFLVFGRPIGRTVSDAVYVLDVIAGIDYNDPATITWSKYIPQGGFKQFLNRYGLKGKRLGIVRNPFFALLNDSNLNQAFEKHFETLR